MKDNESFELNGRWFGSLYVGKTWRGIFIRLIDNNGEVITAPYISDSTDRGIIEASQILESGGRIFSGEDWLGLEYGIEVFSDQHSIVFIRANAPYLIVLEDDGLYKLAEFIRHWTNKHE